MLKNEIRTEDKKAIQEIYQQVKKTSTHLSQLPQFEVLLNQALNTAAAYGKDHLLYRSLEQTMTNQLIPARGMSEKSRDRSFALNDLRLFFLGDLMGWF
jgi:hypothetical protein